MQSLHIPRRMLGEQGSRSAALWIAFLIVILGVVAIGILGGALPQIDPQLRGPLAVIFVCSPLAIALALRYPLAFFGLYAGFVPFENLKLLSGSVTMSRIIGVVAAGAIISSLLIRRKVEPVTRPLLMWTLVVLWLLLTLTWCISFDYGILTLVQELQLFVLFALMSLTPVNAKQLRLLFGLVIVAGAVSALFNIKSYASYDASAVRAISVLGNARSWAGESGEIALDPNNYAAALLAPFVLTLVSMLRERQLGRKFVYFVLFLMLVFGILTTSSRGAFVSMGVILAYFFIRSTYRRQLGAAAVGGFLVSLCLPSLWARIFDPTQGDGSGRYEIWAVAFEAFKRHWLYGAGVGNFQPAFGEAYNAAYQTPTYMTSPDMMSHNLIAGQSVELGSIGLILMLTAWWTQWRTLAQIPRWSRMYDIRVALEALIIGLFVESMFLDTMMRKYIWLAFSLVAITMTVWRHSEERKAS